jgi:hypothetical protein
MIEFKSIPEMYYKEKSGVKNNTLRKVDKSDIRFRKLKDIEKSTPDEHDMIRILRSDNIQDYFYRQIKDVTFWDGWCIITWRS